jgi:hypothetical protein
MVINTIIRGGKKMDINRKKFLASKLASTTNWNGSDLLDILQIALEDANYHSLNKQIEG